MISINISLWIWATNPILWPHSNIAESRNSRRIKPSASLNRGPPNRQEIHWEYSSWFYSIDRIPPKRADEAYLSLVDCLGRCPQILQQHLRELRFFSRNLFNSFLHCLAVHFVLKREEWGRGPRTEDDRDSYNPPERLESLSLASEIDLCAFEGWNNPATQKQRQRTQIRNLRRSPPMPAMWVIDNN